MRSSHRCRRRRGRVEAGVAAVEFALVLPLLLLFATGITSLGHAMIVRYLLANAAYAAARECTLARTPTADCANTRAQQRLEVVKSACKGGPKVDGTPRYNILPSEVSVFDVTASCDFNGGAGLGYLTANRITIGTMRVTVQMPY